jgi:hypothetical protein
MGTSISRARDHRLALDKFALDSDIALELVYSSDSLVGNVVVAWTQIIPGWSYFD